MDSYQSIKSDAKAGKDANRKDRGQFIKKPRLENNPKHGDSDTIRRDAGSKSRSTLQK